MNYSKSGKEEEKKEPEPNFEMLANPARVMKAQLRVLSLQDAGSSVSTKKMTRGTRVPEVL